MVCRAPLGLVSILSGRSQGGARASLALGWLVAGRWPEETNEETNAAMDTMDKRLGLEEAGTAHTVPL